MSSGTTFLGDLMHPPYTHLHHVSLQSLICLL